VPIDIVTDQTSAHDPLSYLPVAYTVEEWHDRAAADPERFTDSGVVDKWFRRNCNDVLGRLCTAKEKGDVLQYLMSLK
jgi:urocanate hydratase